MLENAVDTIAGVATPLGSAGISIIRISGDDAWSIASRIFRAPGVSPESPPQPYSLTYGSIVHAGELLDQALLGYFATPKSYTGEETVELNLHGGAFLTQRVLSLVLESGARQAAAGEFTRRAFLNGKIDLTQAEAVVDIVHAQSDASLKQAQGQLTGRLSTSIASFKTALLRLVSLLNAEIDFADEDTEFIEHAAIKTELDQVAKLVSALIEQAEVGLVLREGVRAVLVGEPNAGKSSLMNALLRENRLIVTDTPGTTRDSVSETCLIQGLCVTLTDTAGIRQTVDHIEQSGIERSFAAIQEADLVLWVINSQQPRFSEEIIQAIEGKRVILLLNKRDLAHCPTDCIPLQWQNCTTLACSAFFAADIEQIETSIYTAMLGEQQVAADQPRLTNARQVNAACSALACIEKAQETLAQGLGDEFLCFDLQQALDALGAITGETTPEDLLDHIFANFCLGK